MDPTYLFDTARDGIFSTSDALRHGIDRHALARLIDDGTIRRLTTGWYAAGPTGDQAAEHRMTTVALLRHLGRYVAASHHSALVLYGLPTFHANLDQVHLMRTGDDWSRHRHGAIFHQHLPELTLTKHTAGLVVPLATAIVQAGLVGDPRASLVAADAATHCGAATIDDLRAELDRFQGHRGIVAVRSMLGRVNPLSESPGESLLRLIVEDLGYRVQCQYAISDGHTMWRADLRVKGTAVLIEFDGLMKYDTRADLIREKRREDRLRALGYLMLRVTWSELFDVRALDRRLGQVCSLAA